MTDINPKLTDTPNSEDWAGEMGLKWLANLSLFEEMIAPIGEALLTQADYQSGETVIDVGCGGGATTMAIAKAVAPGGKVLGADISPDLTNAARKRAAEASLPNIEFLCTDAAQMKLEGEAFDRLFSRFGSMFFADPVAAFTNMHKLVRPAGRIDIAVWGPPRENLWMMEIMAVVRNHIEVPKAIPRAPGPFAYEDLDYLKEILTGGGFKNIDIIAYNGLQAVGGRGASPEDAAQFASTSLAAGRLLADAHPDVQKAAREDLLAVFKQHHVPGEGVMMRGKAWLVSASS